DIPSEIIGYCYDLLFAAGAVDVFTQAISMKKNRPGFLLTVLCPESAIAAIEKVLFEQTTTLGVRRHSAERHKMDRRAETGQTRWGPVQGKVAWSADQPPRFSPEFEECARIARQHGLPLRQVCDEARRAWKS